MKWLVTTKEGRPFHVSGSTAGEAAASARMRAAGKLTIVGIRPV